MSQKQKLSTSGRAVGEYCYYNLYIFFLQIWKSYILQAHYKQKKYTSIVWSFSHTLFKNKSNASFQKQNKTKQKQYKQTKNKQANKSGMYNLFSALNLHLECSVEGKHGFKMYFKKNK